ncbi:hypothetical protein DBR39_07595 [Chryseobacterium sp. KBW03]|uniref:FEKKY domain-containing protein n=1 Tax=Chryseobacterium sp. KBW03 TaxID=2153362 RepID=UPI000F598182|nr:hypothetical protein [Chryseobacterium sp. KBW03]RQO40794.1 hypothetical protein DBR39_07595 [Chryseobacterium sp. KBW03]
MAKFFSFLFIVIIISSCKKEDDGLRNGYFWLYGYGLKDGYGEEAANGISEKWKIKIVDAGGCIIDEESGKKVIRANNKTLAAITKKYGKGWEAKYDQDLEGFVLKSADVMDVLIVNKLFRSMLRDHNIPIDNVDKEVKELNDQGQYEVVVVNPNLKYENKECFKVAVNTKNRTVNLIK